MASKKRIVVKRKSSATEINRSAGVTKSHTRAASKAIRVAKSAMSAKRSTKSR